MASPAPPIIPISSSQTAQSAPPAQQTPPIATPAFRLFLSRISDSARHSLSNCRPWSELIDRSALSRPDSLSDAASRVRKNLSYFRVNYVALLALVLAVSLLSNPFSLLVLLVLLAAWCFLYLFRPSNTPLDVFGRSVSDREILAGLVVLTVFSVFLTSVGSVLITAVTVGAGIVCLHERFGCPRTCSLMTRNQEGLPLGSCRSSGVQRLQPLLLLGQPLPPAFDADLFVWIAIGWLRHLTFPTKR